MKTKEKKSKLVFNEKTYVLGQYAGNLAGLLFATPLMVFITFNSFGKGVGELFEVQAFVFLYIFCFVVIQCWGAVTNTRRDYLRKKWVMEATPQEGAPDRLLINPWRLILPLALIAGFITAAGAALIVPRLGQEPFHLLNINFMAGIPLFAVSSILIGIILPRDQAAFAAALPRTKIPAVPFRRYLLIEHILPWVLIQGIINFAVGLKQFTNEAQKLQGDIPIFTSALDAGIVTAIIVFFMWVSSQSQVRPDVHLGRVPEDKGKAPSVPLMLLLITSCLGFGAVVWGVLALVSGSFISPVPAAGLKAGVVMAAVILGCSLGVWWGRRSETAWIQENLSIPGVGQELSWGGIRRTGDY
jgi:hypothetical protein